MFIGVAMEEFINIVCDNLGIDPPQIVREPDEVFPNDTMPAMLTQDGKKLGLRKNIGNEFDAYFSVAHELRHVWQINKKPYLLDGYRLREECYDLDEYCLQDAEIDANAYAAIVMTDLFRVKPLFQGYSERVKDAINIRIKEIIAGI